MDTTTEGTSSTTLRGDDASDPRRRRLLRALLTTALVCFALPFLTVTCYGEDTVSGVQAATEIDIYPSHAERELAREEPPNMFAFGALAATVGALTLSLGSNPRRRELVGFAAAGDLALVGFYVYAVYRTWGEALPLIGLSGAIVLLVASAWMATGFMPRWITWGIGILALTTIPFTFLHDTSVEVGHRTVEVSSWLFVLFHAALIVSVALAIGAIQASKGRASRPAGPAARPSTFRIACAGVAGLACLAAAGVAAPVLMGAMLSNEYGPGAVGSGLGFASIVLVIYVVASLAAWGVARAIVRGRRSSPLTAARAPISA